MRDIPNCNSRPPQPLSENRFLRRKAAPGNRPAGVEAVRPTTAASMLTMREAAAVGRKEVPQVR
jgi:hypothetical protein